MSALSLSGLEGGVNGHDAPIYKANYAFRAVEVQTGTNDIVKIAQDLFPTYLCRNFPAGLSIAEKRRNLPTDEIPQRREK